MESHEGTSGFAPGTLAVLETSGKGVVIGEVVGITKMGIHMLETHRFEQKSALADMDWGKFQESHEAKSMEELKKIAIGMGVKRRLVRKADKEEIVDIIKMRVEYELESEGYTELEELSRPIERYIFIKHCQILSNLEDIVIEQDIRGFRDTVKDASSISDGPAMIPEEEDED